MATDLENSAYRQIFEYRDDDELLARKNLLVNRALRSHLLALGEKKNKNINIAAGDTKLSVVSFFQQVKQSADPVNDASLSIVPDFRYSSSYGNSIETIVSWSGYSEIVEAARLEDVEAAKRGKALEWIVGTKLGLWTMAQGLSRHSRDAGYQIETTASLLVSDYNDGAHVVAELPDLAKRVKEHGYENFLDYLLDVKSNIEGRVDTLFEYGPQRDQEALF